MFQHAFTYLPTEATFFAFSYPFSFEESTQKLDMLEVRARESPSIYFHREVLYHSLEGRPLEILTISSREGLTTEREDQVRSALTVAARGWSGTVPAGHAAVQVRGQALCLLLSEGAPRRDPWFPRAKRCA